MPKGGNDFTDDGRASASPMASNSSGPYPMVTVNRDGSAASSGSVSARAGTPCVNRDASSVHSFITDASVFGSARSRFRSSAMNVA